MARLALSAAVLLCLALGGCGAGEPSRPALPPPTTGWTTHHDERRGFTMSLPEGWERAEKTVSPRRTDQTYARGAATSPDGTQR